MVVDTSNRITRRRERMGTDTEPGVVVNTSDRTTRRRERTWSG